MVNLSADQLRPYPTGRVLFKSLPGSNLPGYHHLVSSGQKVLLTPVRKIDSTSLSARSDLESKMWTGRGFLSRGNTSDLPRSGYRKQPRVLTLGQAQPRSALKVAAEARL